MVEKLSIYRKTQIHHIILISLLLLNIHERWFVLKKLSRVIWFFQLAHAYMGHAIMDPRVTVNVSRVIVKRFQFFEDQ